MVNLVRLGCICVVLVVQVVGECPQDWIMFDGSCYFVPEKRENWTAASKTCSSYQGYLAEVANAHEHSFLGQLVADYHNRHGGNRYYWLGGTDFVVEGEWRWNTTAQSINYTNWAQGEPNNKPHSHDHDEDCLAMHLTSGSSVRWMDKECSFECQFVCMISRHWIQFG